MNTYTARKHMLRKFEKTLQVKPKIKGIESDDLGI